MYGHAVFVFVWLWHCVPVSLGDWRQGTRWNVSSITEQYVTRTYSVCLCTGVFTAAADAWPLVATDTPPTTSR